MTKTLKTIGHIEDVRLLDALSERYLAYALSTITARSLPDVRDGLKPVHRRLIYAMYQLKLNPGTGFKKCARVVGDVIGKYHPHGDASVYDALVRLAQNFAVRYPLVEGQGNFGSIDGDNAAAMRYTESRLTEVAQALLAGIDENAVDFHPTYDGEELEPDVLPAAFPNLLANGAAGIAVGMATNIPPHNAGELYKAAIALIRKPALTLPELMAIVPGPDFPTGGIIVESKDVIEKAYTLGKGNFRLRAKWHKEDGRFGTWQVVITEIPYQIQKSRLIEQIADLMVQKKLPLLADIRDESTEDVRLVLEPKARSIEPALLMETLYKNTSLETRFSLNMNVLNADNVPGIMNLKEMLQAWLDHRHVVLTRRSAHRQAAVQKRLEILEGFLSVYLNLDEVIRIIREEDEVKPVLMTTFRLTEMQADAVLNMRLRSLRKLEEMEIRKEYDALDEESKTLRALLENKDLRWNKITEELKSGYKQFSKAPFGTRRTTFTDAIPDVDMMAVDVFEKEAITVLITEKGWVKALKGHTLDLENHKLKDGDELNYIIECETTDKIALMGSEGRIFNISANDIPRGRGDGQALRLMVDLAVQEQISNAFKLDIAKKYILSSTHGQGFVISGDNLQSEKRTGKQVLNLKEGGSCLSCMEIKGDMIAVLGANKHFLVFSASELPELTKGQGVILQKYTDKHASLKAIASFDRDQGLQWGKSSQMRGLKDWGDYIGKRATKGKMAPKWVLRGIE